jgi:hypothetical protein
VEFAARDSSALWPLALAFDFCNPHFPSNLAVRPSVLWNNGNCPVSSFTLKFKHPRFSFAAILLAAATTCMPPRTFRPHEIEPKKYVCPVSRTQKPDTRILHTKIFNTSRTPKATPFPLAFPVSSIIINIIEKTMANEPQQNVSQYIYLSSAQQKIAIEREIGPMYFPPGREGVIAYFITDSIGYT